MAMFVAALIPFAVAQETQVDKAVDIGLDRNKEGVQSQQRIDKIADQTGDLKGKYKDLLKVIDGLQVYNTLLQRQIDGQKAEMRDLEYSIDQVSLIERQIVPLMLQMIQGLKEFIGLDIPFLLEERQDRIAKLETLLERADVTAAEKFRTVLEAFDIENEYGRTIEAYKGSLEVEGKAREVDFLRIGRIALAYQAVGGEHNGVWDQKTRKWEVLPAEEFRNHISKGLKIARKQVAPDMLLLPVAAPEAVR